MESWYQRFVLNLSYSYLELNSAELMQVCWRSEEDMLKLNLPCILRLITLCSLVSSVHGEGNCLPHKGLRGLICLPQSETARSADQDPVCQMQILPHGPGDSALFYSNNLNLNIKQRSKFLWSLEESTQSIKHRCFSLPVENLSHVGTFRVWSRAGTLVLIPLGSSYLMWNECALGSEGRAPSSSIYLLNDETTLLEWEFFCLFLLSSHWPVCAVFHLEHVLTLHIPWWDGYIGCYRNLKTRQLFIALLGLELRSCGFFVEVL